MSQASMVLSLPSSLPILPLPPNQGPLFPGLVLSIQLASRTSINLLRAVIRDVENAPETKQAFVGVCPLRVENDRAGRGRNEEAKVDIPAGGADPSPDEKREKGLQVIRLPRDESDNGRRPKVDDINEWGCAARIVRIERVTTGGYVAVVEGLARLRVDRFTSVGYPYFEAKCTTFPESGLPVTASGLVGDLKKVALTLIDTFTALNMPLPALVTKRIKSYVHNVTLATAGGLADILVSTLSPSHADKLELLSCYHAEDRVVKALEMLSRVNEEAGATKRVSERVEGNLSRRQREYFLRQQLEAIAQELRELEGKNQKDGVSGLGNGFSVSNGGAEEGEDEVKDYDRKIEAAMMPPEALTQATRELKRLKRIPQSSVEHGVVRNYLDWLVDMPWGRGSPSDLDRTFLDRARKQLDDDHYGLSKVKKRLLEYLAVLRLRNEMDSPPADRLEVGNEINLDALGHIPDGTAADDLAVSPFGPSTAAEEGQPGPPPPTPVDNNPVPAPSRDKGPILLLVGPPGVGKTSIARSLATSMGRKFHRISLGGVRDEAEIRGHRRTYVGALPGNICQGLRKVGVNNPVFLLDEIDKLSSNNFHGDPAAAMLEVLDPEQNFAFNDHYINCGVDLSKVIFIATANTLDTIAPPLRDRMEIIELSGYVYDEKLAIARKYLLPKQIKANALQVEHVQMADDVLLKLVSSYTMEAGVRQLEREIGAVCRAKAVQFAEARDNDRLSQYDPMVHVEDLEKMLGVEKFEPEVSDAEGRPGVATGLAYRGSGNGGILHVESSTYPGSGRLQLTGNLGDVIRESANLAIAWVRANAWSLGLTDSRMTDVLAKRDIHIHFPAGGVPKDGPSAGVALVMSVVSLLSGKALDVRLAMTGEITLRGLVTPVGGIKEKVLSAHRAGIRKIILPYRNRKDVDADLPERVRKEITFVYARSIYDALEVGFGDALWEGLSDVRERQASRRLADSMLESRL